MPAGGFFRHCLNHVPMFDDFTVAVEAENIDDRFAPVLGRGLAEDVHEHQIAFRRDAFHFGARAGIFFQERSEGVDKGLSAIGNGRIVLDVGFADIFADGFLQFVLIEREVVEDKGVGFVDCLLGLRGFGVDGFGFGGGVCGGR